MSGPLDVISSYLVSLGFSIDQNQYRKFTDSLAKVNTLVNQQTTSMSGAYLKAASTITGALASITLATAGLMDKVAQADLGYQKFALRMYMAKDQAKQLKIVTDALGESLEDIAWNPELRERYFSLMKQSGGMEPGGGQAGQLRYLRDIRFEFTRMKVEAVYASQWVTQHLFKMLYPMGDMKQVLSDLNDRIQRDMPIWTKKVADWLGAFIQLGGSAWRVLKDIGSGLEQIWTALSPTGREAIIAGGLIALFAASGPFGRALMVISTLILAVDDFYAFIDGRKSSSTLAPIWGTLIYTVEKVTKGLWLAVQAYSWLTGQKPPDSKGFIQDMTNTWNSAGEGPMTTKTAGRGIYGASFPGSSSIMMAESHGNPNAINKNRNGSVDRGLFQINSIHVPDLMKAGIIQNESDLFDPVKNSLAANWVYQRQGLGAWRSSFGKWGGDIPLASSHGSTTIGDINVYVGGSNASPKEIGNEVARTLREFQGVY